MYVDAWARGRRKVAVVDICRCASLVTQGRSRLETGRLTGSRRAGQETRGQSRDICWLRCSPPVQVRMARRLREGVPRDSVAISPGTSWGVQDRLVWVRREGKRVGVLEVWFRGRGPVERVQSRADVSRLFSNRETGQVTLVLVWRRRAQERRGRILCGRGMTLNSQSSRPGGAEGSVNVTRAGPGS